MIRASSWTTLVFVALFGVVACAGAALVFLPDLIQAYYDGPGGRATREALGFELRRTPVEFDGRVHEMLSFSHVRPDGLLGAAGVRDGDTLVTMLDAGCALDWRPDSARLYELLETASARPLEFDVIPVTALGKQNTEPWGKSVRTISIPAHLRKPGGV